jgi:hypothetical protein
MKHAMTAILFLCAIGFAENFTQSGSTTPISRAVLWGGTRDSTSSILLVGGVTKRDSAGTYVTSDSCSKWVPVENGGTRANTWYTLSFMAKGISSPPATVIRIDSRYCGIATTSFQCGFIVASGSHYIYGSKKEVDTLSVASVPTSFTGLSYSFYVTHGNQQRFCLDETVVSAGDSLYLNTAVDRGM